MFRLTLLGSLTTIFSFTLAPNCIANEITFEVLDEPSSICSTNGTFRECSANETLPDGRWPLEIPMTQLIFSPNRPNQFADTQGLDLPSQYSTDSEVYLYLSLTPPWTSNQTCNQPIRRRGFIHTTGYVVESDDYLVRIAVPIRFKMRSSFTGEIKRQTLDSPILTASVLELNSQNMTFTPVGPHRKITLRQLCSEIGTCQDTIDQQDVPLNFDYDYPVRTGTFRLRKGTDIRVRFEWNPELICDERESSLLIGDQIRLIYSGQ